MLLKVEENSRGLEDREVVPRTVDNRRNATVGVYLDEPWFLLLSTPQIDLLHTVTGSLVSNYICSCGVNVRTRIEGRMLP